MPLIYTAARQFRMYSLVLIVGVGLICNALALRVFLSRYMRQSSHSWYLAALAISDSMVLIRELLIWMKNVAPTIHLTSSSLVVCYLANYIPTACAMFSAWLIVAFTAERYISVRFPLRRMKLCTTKRAKVIILVEFSLSLALSSFIFVTYDISYNHEMKQPLCSVKSQFKELNYAFTATTMIVGAIIVPALVICILNAAILRMLYQFSHQRYQMTHGRDCSASASGEENKVTSMLVLVSTFFVLLNTPHTIIWIVGLTYTFQNKYQYLIFMGVKYLTMILFDLNYTINFFLYTIYGRTFRDELRNVFRCCRCCRKPPNKRVTLADNSQTEHFELVNSHTV